MAKSTIWVYCDEKKISVHPPYCNHCWSKTSVNFRSVAGLPDTWELCRAAMAQKEIDKQKGA